MRRDVLGTLAMLVLVGLAGCADGGQDGAEPEELGGDVEVEVTDTTGAIRGVVVDDAIRPLADALIRIEPGGLSANTSSEGTFSFSRLEPGTYLIEATRLGYSSAQQSVDVVAGDADPPATRIQLLRDPSQQFYYAAQQFTGYIICTTSFVAVCGAPNVVSNVLLCPAFGICQGNLTDDKFGFDLYYEPNATYIQSEAVWDSTQPASTQLSMQMETIQGCDDEYYERSVASDSPLINFANATEIAAAQIGDGCSIFHSLFSGDTAGTPAGVTVQQQFDVYSTAFYGYLPPEGWSFARDGYIPEPPEV